MQNNNMQKDKVGGFNTNLVIWVLVLIIILVAVGVVAFSYNSGKSSVASSSSSSSSSSIDAMMSKSGDTIMNKSDGDKMSKSGDAMMSKSGDVMVKDVKGSYVNYSSSVLNESKEGKKIVLFFHAPWCPHCKATDDDIKSHLDQIPNNVVIVKADYDGETALKKTYGVTQQNTAVYLNTDASAKTKFSGFDTLSQLLKGAGIN